MPRWQPCVWLMSAVLLTLASAACSQPASVASAEASAPPDPLRVLFVGNSYTAYFNMPAQVQAMCDHAGVPAEIEMVTAGGKSWRWHMEQGKAPQRIAQGGWDVVVLQNHSRGALDMPDEFDTYGQQLIELIQAHDATPMLYLTWARQHLPEDQATITEKYSRLASDHGAKVAPVGVAWEKWLAESSDVPLHRSDRSHPNRAGSYLTACVFFAALTGQSPEGAPHFIAGRDVVEKTDVLADLPPDLAERLQSHAFAVTQAFDLEAAAAPSP
ncbi:MAG: hypothetical protein AAGF84_04865 [Planctomycetota bacterium]